MIISHKHKFIFIAVPKTATHAVRMALRPELGDQDEEHCTLFEQKRTSYNFNSSHGHIPASAIRQAVGEQVWNEYFKFGFVRNPFDKAFSTFSFLKGRGAKEETLEECLDSEEIKRRCLFRPQAEYFDEQMDYIGKYETLQESFNLICSKVGIKEKTLVRINSSVHKDYKSFYSEALKEKVQAIYKQDLVKFNYEF